MATHSSILAWKIPWKEKPGRLQSIGSQSQTRLSDFTLSIPSRAVAHIPHYTTTSTLPSMTVCVQFLSHVRLFVTPWTAAHQAPLSMGFSRQEYWSGLPFAPPGDLPISGIKLMSPVFERRILYH